MQKLDFPLPTLAAPVLLVLALLFSPASATSAANSPERALPPLDSAQWLWSPGDGTVRHFRKVLKLPEPPAAATLLITADNDYALYLNGTFVGSDEGPGGDVWQTVERYDVRHLLARGPNVVAIHGGDLGGSAGVVAALRLEFTNSPPVELATDASWRVAPGGRPADYSHPEFVEGPEWRDATVLGPMGMEPWGSLAWSAAADAARAKRIAPRIALSKTDKLFRWPEAVVFLGDDCSVYVPQRGDAWGVCFRVGDWSRAYTEFDLPCPSKIGRQLYALEFTRGGSPAARTRKPDARGASPSPLNPDTVGRVRGETDPDRNLLAPPHPGPLPPAPRGGEGVARSRTRAAQAKPRLLFDAGAGAIGSPSVSFDGRSVFVAMAREGEKFFHIYKLPVAGGPPQRLTDGPFHDLDPAELPDGRIVFASTRIGSFEEYHNPPSRALFVMEADGTDIHPITFTPIFDNEPKVMADGRIVFIRSDNFFDRAKVETHLHVIRPDGTDGLTEVGADVGADYGTRLRVLGYGSPAPLPDGRLAFISNRGNFISSVGSPERSYHRLPDQLGDLAPLPDGRLLATVLRREGKQQISDVLAVIDPRDNAVVPIYESRTGSIHSPVFLGERPRPPVVPEFVDRARAGGSGATGFLLCQDVRFTRKTKADWRQIRAIRVLGAIPLTTRSSHSHIVHAGHETVELGTVPIAPDGSFFVEVPADTPLALQAVDAEGRSELNEMSWIYVRPGERRSCLGCHNPRENAPVLARRDVQALRAPPLKALGQGNPHRSRGNNSGVTGMMDLQFERFRECASLNRHLSPAGPLTTGKQEIAALVEQLRAKDEPLKLSAAQRLAIFRDHAAAPALAERLKDKSREVRVAAAMALAACGTRDSVPPLLDALEDRDPVVAQAAVTALMNLVGGGVAKFNAFADLNDRRSQVQAWRDWFAKHSWEAIERTLLPRIHPAEPDPPRRAIVALGHIGGDAARAALREFIKAEAAKNPYRPFERDNRTDSFTYPADSPLNPRALQEAVRALGHLQDTAAVPLLAELLARNIEPRTANLYLAEAAIEALGRIGTPDAESALIDTFARLREYHEYVGWYSDHPALYACHSSPLHARIIEALDALGSTRAASLASHLIRSVPTDPDRALFPENDDYETLVGRILRRGGRGPEVIETCLALLGDPQAKASDDLKTAITTTHAAWAGKPGPENRAAQILSLACRDHAVEPRVRAAFERFRALPEEPIKRELGNPNWTPVRHWVLFYLARALGNLGDARSVDTLLATLADDLNEARHGRPDPSEPNIHLLQLDYTPCWRAAAAWALGRIGDGRAAPTLVRVVANLENAPDVRHAAAEALESLADPASLAELKKLADGYPEVSVRRALLAACAKLNTPRRPAKELVQGTSGQ
ncbi:MAG: HEAT repeat domain-containing protein [Verrucomicrobia bacterium]|nr:HEAT repeat domain-containing protein [Verrucomicrobiota bacterium]